MTETSPTPTPSRWQADEAPVGHFTVLRALPTRTVQAIGPFVFLDHFGPAAATPQSLPAHPHAGIEVMTYLLEGANAHRDSAGHYGEVEAGGAQWMRAGRGILHAEAHLPARGPTIHGLQIWARLPRALQHSAPAYRAIAAQSLPQWVEDAGGARLRLLSGHCGGHEGPIPVSAPSVLLHVQLPPGARTTLALTPDFEHGLYGIGGTAQVAGEAQAVARGDCLWLTGTTLALANPGAKSADVLLLGGARAERPLVFGGPFVFDSHAALRQAQRDFHAGAMGTLDGVPF